jgi:hypothetical protein
MSARCKVRRAGRPTSSLGRRNVGDRITRRCPGDWHPLGAFSWKPWMSLPNHQRFGARGAESSRGDGPPGSIHFEPPCFFQEKLKNFFCDYPTGCLEPREVQDIDGTKEQHMPDRGPEPGGGSALWPEPDGPELLHGFCARQAVIDRDQVSERSDFGLLSEDFARVLGSHARLKRHVPYRHPSGAIIWVRRDSRVEREILDQLAGRRASLGALTRRRQGPHSRRASLNLALPMPPSRFNTSNHFFAHKGMRHQHVPSAQVQSFGPKLLICKPGCDD